MSNVGGGSFDWNPSAIDNLKTRWATGAPVRQIARDMLTTPGTITGKAQRLGLERRVLNGKNRNPFGMNGRPRKLNGRDKIISKARKPAEDKNKNLPPDQSLDAVSLLDVRAGRCRWPLNETTPIADFRFCGAAVHNKHSYCARHLRLSVNR